MIATALYLGSILLANWLVIQFGIIHFGPLTFPAGAIAIGLTFSARDIMQEKFGRWGCWFWMGVAGGMVYLLDQKIAMASVTAFVIAESIDWAVYTYLPTTVSKRMIISNLVGIPIDSVAFVVIAFGFAWPVIIGQSVVKFASSLLVVVVRRWVR